jgi:hypothetical protein
MKIEVLVVDGANLVSHASDLAKQQVKPVIFMGGCL